MANKVYQGLDASRYNGNIDWTKVRKAGKQFAVLRCTSGSRNAVDSRFYANLHGCDAMRIPVGVYRYGLALTPEAAQAEARAVLDAIKGHKMPCLVWYDVEDATQQRLPKTQLTAVIQAFQKVITDAGYKTGIYCSQSWYDRVIDTDAFACPFWIARYGSNDGRMHTPPTVRHTLWGWQYTSRGRVPGIRGNVDLDVSFVSPNEGENEAQPPSAAIPQDFCRRFAGIYRVKADKTEMLAEAGNGQSMLTTIPKGAKVRCRGYFSIVDDKCWLYADWGTFSGFCACAYLQRKRTGPYDRRRRHRHRHGRGC